jgi:signal transduction histidine kinase
MDLSEVIPALGGVVLERRADGRFAVRGGVPAWSRSLVHPLPTKDALQVDEAFPFLGAFLPDAEAVWAGAAVSSYVESELWTEVDQDGREVHLSAVAVRLAGASALVIMRSERLFAETRGLLQRARELRMTHRSLMREIEQKDVLIHAIVHDLAAPLHSMIGVLSLLGERPRGEPEAGWIGLALQAAHRQRALIGEILDVFAAEGGAGSPSSADGVELSQVIEQVAAEREPVARSKNVSIRPVPPLPSGRVAGDETRLVRVLTNLVDNALRNSPPGGVVRIVSREGDDALPRDRTPDGASADDHGRALGEHAIVVLVEDDGPGVSPDVLPRLFERFGRGREGAAGTGLGLYFCRITVENWGGGIGYERRESGGARFWVRLPRVPGVGVAAGGRDQRRGANPDVEAASAGR